MVTVTDKAKSKIEHLIEDSGLDASYFLRVSVQGGGCSGLSYNLDFDNEIKKGDQFFEDRGNTYGPGHEILPVPGRHRTRFYRWPQWQRF